MDAADLRDIEALFRAVKLENVDEVERWCAGGGAVNVVDTRTFKKSTPLHWAAYTGNPDVVSILLDYGADPNAQESDMKVPLHLAAFEGNYDAVRLLLAAGADFTVCDVPGKTPCQVALMNGHAEVARLFPDYLDCSRGGIALSASSSVQRSAQGSPGGRRAGRHTAQADAVQGHHGAPAGGLHAPTHHHDRNASLASSDALRPPAAAAAAPPRPSAIPEVLIVHAGPNAYPVEGTFALARGEGWEGMPVWECELENGRIGCIYSGTNGLWIVTEDVCHMESDSGLITSAHKHDGALPHDVLLWETHNGYDWVQDATVAVEAEGGPGHAHAHARGVDHAPQQQQQQDTRGRGHKQQQQQRRSPPRDPANVGAPAGAAPPMPAGDPHAALPAGVAARLLDEEGSERSSWVGQEDRWRRHILKRLRAEERELLEDDGGGGGRGDAYAPRGRPGAGARRGRSVEREHADPAPPAGAEDPHATAEATLREAAKRALMDSEEYEWYLADKQKRRAERRAQRRAERQEYKVLRRAERRREREEYKKQQQQHTRSSARSDAGGRSRSRSRPRTRSASAHSRVDRYGRGEPTPSQPRGRSRSRSKSRRSKKHDPPATTASSSRGRSLDRHTRVHSQYDTLRDTSIPRSTRSSHSRTSRASRTSRRSRSRSRSVASSDYGDRTPRPVWLPPGSASSATGKRIVRDFNDYRTRLAGWDDVHRFL